ncbi:nuclear transport factor 2 family protein [Micromonospora sp. NPDC050417]|uniref:nuclear transport factor 2 family protein n=1 Tax=Micromonospora sp. NPDC050417 TaxID=3364280 RepID=UPI003797D8E2
MAVDNDTLVRNFIEAFAEKKTELLEPFLDENVMFHNYGDKEVHGRDNVLEVWRGVFQSFETVRFETVNQAVNGSIVLAEQVHGLGLAGKQVATIMNMAVYDVRDGKILAWRDYTNPEYARTLL